MITEVVIGLLGPFIELGKCVVPPIKRQLNYLCCFHGNTQSLMVEAKKLHEKRVGLKMQVENDQKQARVIVPQVQTWLADANDIQLTRWKIEAVSRNVQIGCVNIISRYSASKKAKQTADTMMKLRDDCKFDTISQPPPPVAIARPPLGQMHDFSSRKQIEDDIMKALGNTEVNMIGISGMGGVGKTTLARKLSDRVKEQNLFSQTVMVTVSQSLDKFKIQREIAEFLGMGKDFQVVESLQVRAEMLRNRLACTGRILIILDDIWEKINLMELGVPCDCDSRGCTTLLTSRDKKVLIQMDAQIFEIDTLREEEAWSLFRDKAGRCVDDPKLVSIAKKVMKECKGLPIAITTVGSTLKGEEKDVWEDALHQLESHNLIEMPEFLEGVYNPLYLSYKFLKEKQAKSFFLLCSIFPEDSDISLEELTMYSMGLDMFVGVDNLDQARKRVSRVVARLKSRYLLMSSDVKHHVRMHDVIRDVAIAIATKKELIGTQHGSRGHLNQNCKWVSMFLQTRNEFPDHFVGSNFPNLRLLIIHKLGWYGHLQMKDLSILEGMKELNVLSLKGIKGVGELLLPEATKLMKNLRALHLVRCAVNRMSFVGELLNFEILCWRECREIEELPKEIGRLKCLKLLDLSECVDLVSIAPGIISQLIELEELKMLGCFKGWESSKVNEKERRNASLKELESLTKLICLEIEIGDSSLVAEEMCLSSNLVRYKILIGEPEEFEELEELGKLGEFEEFEKVVSLLSMQRGIDFGDWIQNLMRSSEVLYLYGDGLIKYDLSQVHNTLNTLFLGKCETVKEVVGACASTNIFPILESLILYHLPNIKAICGGVGKGFEVPMLKFLWIRDCPQLRAIVWSDEECFNVFCGVKFGCALRDLSLLGCHNIKSIWCNHISLNFYSTLVRLKIQECDSIASLFSIPMAKNLATLEYLSIKSCKNMEKVIAYKEELHESSILFPQLIELELEDLPMLSSFCDGKCSLEFLLLVEVNIMDCPRMEFFALDGSARAPKLTSGCINQKDLTESGIMEDLNSLVRQHIAPIRMESTYRVIEEHDEIKEES